jgi:hypothetical protein
MTDATQNRYRHLIASGAGVAAVVAFFLIPPGIVGYLATIAIIAVLIGHSAARRHGSLRGSAIIGLALSYLILITSVGMLVVRLTRLGG